ncbi:hypothetical protein QBC36DRAFT_198497 [Triangularia setosa]|uniref:Uncharacterized protein n=1 Tax=Triangularia setosa TaxID=2587417 RepID=A0AAN6VYX3_9PEZI|nr:hypothetical protein QBC36DRAFT_198497 [Podospora setosa]
MLHSYSSTAAEPSSSVDHSIHNSSYCDHDNRRRLSPTSSTRILNDPPAGLQSSHRAPKAAEYPGLEHLLRARELRRQQAREQHEMMSQQQSAHYFQTHEEQDLAKALKDPFIADAAHHLFLKNKQREEDRVRKAQDNPLKEQYRWEADRAWEQYCIAQYHQYEKEKMERRQRMKERKTQQQQQQHVSFAAPTTASTAPAPLVSLPTSTYSTSTSSSNSTEEISNPENKQLQRLEKRFQLRRPSPDNDNPNTEKETYQNPFMQPASRAYFYSPPSPSPRATTSPTISLSTLPPLSPVLSASYLKHDYDREKENKQLEKEREKAQDKVKEWMGGRERARYRSSSRFRKETRHSRFRHLDDHYESVWEKEERETKVSADDWDFDDREGFKSS